MSTKALIAAKITAIATGSPNTAAEVRSIDTDFLNELFPAPVSEVSTATHVNTTINSAFTSKIKFSLVFKKSGNTISVNGTVTSLSATSLNDGANTMIDFSTDPFKPRNTWVQEGGVSGNSYPCGLTFKDNAIYLRGILQPFGVLYINDTYTSND